MRKSIRFVIIVSWLLVRCNNIEDAEPSNRDTFIFFYEKSSNFYGKVLEPIADGYLLGGELQQSADVFDVVVSKVSAQGTLIAEKRIPNMSINSLKSLSEGYLVLGYRIEVNDTSQNLNDRVIKSAQLIKLNENLEMIGTPLIIKDNSPGAVTIDYEGNAIATYSSDSIVVVGTYQAGAQPARTFLAGINTSDLTLKWRQDYGLVDRNFKNSTSAFIDQNNIVWASGSSREQQNTEYSYVTIPVIKPKSVFVNIGQYGENDNQNYTVGNICKSALGFGVVGTYTDVQSRVKNIYFVRFDVAGNLVSGSNVFYDAILSKNNSALTDKSLSETNEVGLAIAATKDGGYILAGSANDIGGNGGENILLIRLDPFGNILWNRTYGGGGDEEVRAIHETSNGGFIMCGTSATEGLSAAFIMKTNANGEIEK